MNNQNEFEDLIRKFKLDDDSNAEQTGSPQEPQRRPAFNYEDDQRRYDQARSHAAAATAQRPAAQPAARPAASQAGRWFGFTRSFPFMRKRCNLRSRRAPTR